MAKLVVGVNDLKTVCPELADEWEVEKNGGKKPSYYTKGSGAYVWWKCSDCGYVWEARISHRASGIGCPHCAGKVVIPGIDDLATTDPEIASQWSDRNGEKTPDQFGRTFVYKAWWKCPTCHGEWRTSIATRTKGSACPYCTNKKVLVGFNDLATTHPELTKEWGDKNGNLTPYDVVGGSGKKIWWCCSKHGHEWQASIQSRNKHGYGCPYCSGQRVLAGFNDLGTKFPEIASEWDVEKNDGCLPSDYTYGSGHKAWWKCSAFGHSYRAAIADRTIGRTGCPVCAGKKVLIGFNDLATIRPDIAAEWDSDMNGDISPYDVTLNTSRKVWWRCDDFGHSYQAAIYHRTHGQGCPICAGKRVLPGFNDLATTHPEIASEWSERNGDMTPEMFTHGSSFKAWWVCKEHGHEWQAIINTRTSGNGCPYCGNKIVLKGFNDLATTHPEIARDWSPDNDGDPTMYTAGSAYKAKWKCAECGHEWQARISHRVTECGCRECAKRKGLFTFRGHGAPPSKEESFGFIERNLLREWDFGRNEIDPYAIYPNCTKEVWWKCAEHGHPYKTSVAKRVDRSHGCPYCSNRRLLVGFNDLATTHPHLVNEWSPVNELTPDSVSRGSSYVATWICPSHGHLYKLPVKQRVMAKDGCPYCNGTKVLVGFNDLATTHPHLAYEWNDKNDRMPTDYTRGSADKVWWKCAECGHEWEATIGSRSQGHGCPECAKKKIAEAQGKPKPGKSLEEMHPQLAKEWHPSLNAVSPADVSYGSSRKAWWLCPTCHYVWESVIVTRYHGVGCPSCSSRRKTSFPEKAVFYYLSPYGAYENATGVADNMGNMELDVWIPDMNVAIEYDGSVWHSDTSRDLKKDRACHEAGIRMIRIREKGCPSYDTPADIVVRDDSSVESLERAIVQVGNLIGLHLENSVDIRRDGFIITQLRDTMPTRFGCSDMRYSQLLLFA